MKESREDSLEAVLLRFGKVRLWELEWAKKEASRLGVPLLEVLKQAGSVDAFDLIFARMENCCSSLALHSNIGKIYSRLPTFTRF